MAFTSLKQAKKRKHTHLSKAGGKVHGFDSVFWGLQSTHMGFICRVHPQSHFKHQTPTLSHYVNALIHLPTCMCTWFSLPTSSHLFFFRPPPPPPAHFFLLFRFPQPQAGHVRLPRLPSCRLRCLTRRRGPAPTASTGAAPWRASRTSAPTWSWPGLP